MAVFVAYLGYAAWADHAFLFDRFLLPTSDYAADDLLIFQAKRLHLLHGNYSRFGFHHPGPWFLFAAGVGERVLYDWTGWFASYTAAQAFGIFIGFATAFAVSCRLWLLTTGKIGLALAAIALIIATILAPLTPSNLFIEAFWTPYATVAASLLLATGLLGMALRGSSWLPLALLGGVEMMHGHASFLGIVPMILLVALVLAGVFGHLPFRILDWRSVANWVASNRSVVLTSLAVAALYAAPLVLNLILHWPGDFGDYLLYAGKITPLPVREAAQYASRFMPLYCIWLLLFLLPEKKREIGPGAKASSFSPKDLRYGGLLVFCSGALPAFWYSWHGVDNVAYAYLLIWFSPFVATALACATLYTLEASSLNSGLQIVLCLAAAFPVLVSLPATQSSVAIDIEENLAIQRAVARLLAEPRAADGARTELILDHSDAAWVPVWTEMVSVLAAFQRAGRHDLCISPGSWHVLFGESNRCDPSHDRIDRRLIVTNAENHGDHPLLQIYQSVIRPPAGLATGHTAIGDNATAEGLSMETGWSIAEADGVWTDEDQARLAFPTGSTVPRDFQLTLSGILLAPQKQPQTVHVTDSGNRALGVLRGPSGQTSITVPIDRQSASDWVSLTLRVDHPVRPLDLRIDQDTRRLGFKLTGLTISR